MLMGHVPVKKHLNSMGLLDGNVDCRFCKVDTENSVPYLLYNPTHALFTL